MKELFLTFKSLSKGVVRLIISLGFIIPLYISIWDGVSNGFYGNYFYRYFFSSFAAYWFLVIIGIWVYGGFQNDKHEE